MPSNLPSSFASAAAGSRDARAGARTDGRGSSSGDWSRAGRSTNGTLTFRRTSATPSSQHATDSLHSAASADPAVISAMPVGSTAVDSPAPQRYTRDELLSILSVTQNSQPSDVSTLFMPGWNPGHVNGGAARGWGKSGDSHVVPQDPDICWDAPGSNRAVGLQDMTAEERDLFASDVNSTMKPPAQNKDGNHHAGGALNGRKTSVSHGGSNFGLSSPSTASRPGTRRRETTDTNPYSAGGLTSPTSAIRPPRDDLPFWLARRNTDLKDSTFEEPEEEADIRDAPTKPLPFGGLVRNNTTPSSPGFGASSPWHSSPAPNVPGMGTFGNFALAGSAVGEKRPGNARGESRLAHLLPRDSSESMTNKANEDPGRSWRPRHRTDTDPFGDESISGSAMLGGAQDTSPPPMTHPPLYDTPVKGSAGDFGMSGLNLGSRADHENTPLSPSETNPYRSPPGDRGEHDDAGDKLHGLGGSSEQASAYGGGLPRSFAHPGFDGSDRSQTSSVGAKVYPLGNLTGWPSSGTPDRERAPFTGFGGSLFGGMGDLQSPSLGNLGGVFGPASTTGIGTSGSFGRGSKLGSLFPPAMQNQMQNQIQSHDNESLGDSIPDLRQSNPLGAIGRNPLGDHGRETESPMRPGRGVFADMFAQAEPGRTPGASESLHGGVPGASQGQAFTPTSNGPAFPSTQAADPPLRPGHQQGPFTGLEMNDWYKANFFTPDLRVKKVEDGEFEPLGQLIRRIGNSREPFLVPQIGIPHGPPSQTGPFSPNAGGVIQPPLVGAFPAFGRTLTAEEQNNLERRKQEEQYMMARQREFMSTQQSTGRGTMSGVPGLNHHSSAHSLQSQPSFGSITSPIGMPPQAPIGAIGTGGSFLESLATRQPAAHGSSGLSLDMFRDEELTRLSVPERQMLASLHGNGAVGGNPPPQPIGMRSQLPGSGELAEDAEGFRGRLQEFEQLRAQHDADMMEQQQKFASRRQNMEEHAPAMPSPRTQARESQIPEDSDESESGQHTRKAAAPVTSSREFKEYQHAQAAAAAAKLSGLPMPFPPPPSATPLPAPAPQRVRSNLPEQYATSSRSGTPDMASPGSTQPPTLAPWAKDSGPESHKGPSLKEIQQAEALKAAKAEEAAVLARRAMLEQEAAREREREKATTLAPGLPTSSTWGTASPVSSGQSSSPWTKPAPGKGPAPGLTAAAQALDRKKTLADIQREEEARKLKAKELAVQTGVPSSTGKRYADLASKPNAMPLPATAPGNNTTGGPPVGWATVGAGGKVKLPTGPASQGRSASSTSIKPAVVAAPSPRPTIKTANTSTGAGRTEAMNEFTKWLNSQLTRGITGVTDIDTFASTLIAFPLVEEIISDAIYANSKTMDGRHFAQEFIRRKKLAEKGVIEKQPANSPSTDTQTSSAGGWNEVAKKTSHKEAGDANPMLGAGFKGLVGSGVLDAMIKMKDVTKISILSRRDVKMVQDIKDPRVKVIIHNDFSKYDPAVLSQLKGASGCVWALGISQTQVGKEEYVKITKDYSLAASEAFQGLAPDSEPFNFVYVSGYGATIEPGRGAAIFARVKGETELALASMRKANPLFHASSVRPCGIDASAHEAIKPYIPTPPMWHRLLVPLMMAPIRIGYSNLHSPTQELGRFLTEMAMGKYRFDSPAKDVQMVGQFPILENSAFRRLSGL
ncbi:Uu.00g055580.m01.CDS01 [Anthostomella pinea]|uniref:Uu.00g055580.m01.CDS01 n=1 Tax=Anthostomella pinea TaxID=933095 RepID=A0AAI8YPP7_9PEZI|nr:Uu.00g055580.m01.CDS01 [Anthostomella pinea]